MVEAGILLTFALVLLAGIVLGAPLLPLLVFGMLLFASYGLWRGFSAREVARMAASGLKSVGSVLTLFVLIGALTASWRAAGTIPAITCWSATLVSPRNLVLLSFLLTSGMSMLVGSSYAAAATVGVICMTIATAMKAAVALVGGAILAGAFVGDRCSPMSSSAALVASITKTQVFDNVRRMVRTGAVPFALCCVVYGIAGMTSSGSAMRPSFAGSFASSFDLGWVVIVPTALILVLSLLKVSVKRTMVASLAAALLVCVFVQHISVAELPAILVFGYKCKNMAIARMASQRMGRDVAAPEVFALADGGDADALAVLEHAAECLARGVSNINAVVDPDVFVFGGSVALKNPGFMDLVFQKAKRYVLDPDSLLFREATCGGDAGLVGAALLV